jgi:glycine/D-amino acid oxidase-like deaminating enzyme
VGLAEAIDGDGGRVFEQTRALDIRLDFPCTVKTSHGSLRAEHVVVATHLPFFDPTGLFAKTSPSRSYALAVTLAEPAPPGMYLSADPATRSVRPLVSGSNQAVLAGEKHKVGHGRDTHAHYEALEGWARERFRSGRWTTAGRPRTTCRPTTSPTSAGCCPASGGCTWPPGSRSGG